MCGKNGSGPALACSQQRHYSNAEGFNRSTTRHLAFFHNRFEGAHVDGEENSDERNVDAVFEE